MDMMRLAVTVNNRKSDFYKSHIKINVDSAQKISTLASHVSLKDPYSTLSIRTPGIAERCGKAANIVLVTRGVFSRGTDTTPGKFRTFMDVITSDCLG